MSAAPGEEPNDASLVLRICDRDEAAFSCLVHRHATRFYGLAWRVTLNRAKAEDLVQEAFAKLWAEPEKFDPARGAAFTTWFSRVVVHLAIDTGRREKRLSPLSDAMTAALDDGQESPEAALIRTERDRRMDAAMGEIDPRQRAALALVFCEGAPQKEAAERMGLGLKAFESLLSRGKTALRARLEKNGALEKRRKG